jgi:hypothetical protein
VGVTAIESRVAAVTVSVVEPETLPRVAVMVVEPGLAAVVRPLPPPILVIEPTFGIAEVQTTDPVRSCLEPSV